ncbi:shikimate dehydrogenase [Arcobacter sp. CECT 8986]|uniref:shikimate dehydrogenase n=1 Tax=Arcobacter sp. CECT 8986 TaxID=2044507 RepID=UPI001009C6EA|nr:shikimate dehydrogenase [Arcobacter sp. CECT 8986]RXK00962.1 shikimate dehydrogenase [Arcobacter sp. CECT 8986]
MSEDTLNNTQVFAIFGDPVEHSKSPQMHNSAFEYLDIDAVYKKHHLKDGKKLKDEFLNNLYNGANITVPHKEQAFNQADEVVGIANKIKAVNTYVKKDDKVVAYNTDAPGFLKAIESFGEVRKVLILGAGGTSKAIALALQEEGKDVVVVNRSESKLDFFKENNIKCYSWQDFRLDYFDLVVNSTSAGLKDDKLPMNKSQLENIFLNSTYAFDCIYGKETPFLALAKKEGLKVKDGEDMLLYQGVLAFEYFTNRKIDLKTIEIMRKALKEEN